MRLSVRSDSVTAISAVTKLSARTSVLNALGAEMALILEENECSHPEVAHVSGVSNKVADALSRLAITGEKIPEACVGARQRVAPRRDSRLLRLFPHAFGSL